MDLVATIWGDLKLLGFEGSIQSFHELCKWLYTTNKVYRPRKCIESKNTISGDGFLYKQMRYFDGGNYGAIYEATYCKENEEKVVFIKKCPKYPRTLLMESLLQQIAHSVLKEYGFTDAVPRILDILEHPKDGILCSIDHIPNSLMFAEFLNTHLQLHTNSVHFDHILFEIIAQVASYMAILESTVHFNHRDLKSDNVLMIVPTDTWSHTVSIGSYSWKLQGNCKAILIDFGMACIGTSKKKVIVSADQSMMSALDFDFCPKEGRDMFLLFVNLWNIPALRNALSVKGRQLFYKWLRDHTSRVWADEFLKVPIEKLKANFEYMCSRLNLPTFRSESCNPIHILKDIAAVYPDIVQFNSKTIHTK